MRKRKQGKERGKARVKGNEIKVSLTLFNCQAVNRQFQKVSK